MRKKERAALVAIIAVMLIAFGCFGLRVMKNNQDESIKSIERQAVNSMTMLRDELLLDSVFDEQGIPSDSSYVAGFGFSGRMMLRVDDACIRQSLVGDGRNEVYDRDYDGFVVCTIRLRNIDAKTDEISHIEERPYRFNISGVCNLDPMGQQGIDSGDFAYFDGTPENAGEKEGYCFDLEPGEERSYVLAFGYYKESIEPGIDIDLYAGCGCPWKFRLDLGLTTDDMLGV